MSSEEGSPFEAASEFAIVISVSLQLFYNYLAANYEV